LQIITDVAVDPAGNLWVANNWDTPEQGFKRVPEPALSARFGGNGVVPVDAASGSMCKFPECVGPDIGAPATPARP